MLEEKPVLEKDLLPSPSSPSQHRHHYFELSFRWGKAPWSCLDGWGQARVLWSGWRAVVKGEGGEDQLWNVRNPEDCGVTSHALSLRLSELFPEVHAACLSPVPPSVSSSPIHPPSSPWFGTQLHILTYNTSSPSCSHIHLVHTRHPCPPFCKVLHPISSNRRGQWISSYFTGGKSEDPIIQSIKWAVED